MVRWAPNARGRLEQAALELFGERGYDATTVKEIAERAGLTERTFFRHFADKREVLFGGTTLQDGLVGTLAEIPEDTAPLAAVAATLEAAGELFDGRRDLVRQRQALIAAHPELQERELIKLATLGSALAAALRERGIAEPAASLAAEAGMAVFKVAFERWLEDAEEQAFTQHLRDGFAGLKTLTAGA
ncbi:TetR family transcriptional regulator [Streptomyces sp. A7024]|uniref:TetR family transcriptional regulator n=1 Tax=Streptomyces coryli TaxID=1128680 RepID=A0A6G4TV84_9ACTN|nr:TetR/AcrR family transcriptional regulator [Streptomyces coryli]NGN63682.1 TetR family transcriptional regulator [Streptomyces coryli]